MLHLMLVGRGYTSKGPGDIPPITTRRLTPVTPSKRAFSQEEELGKLVVGSYSEYNNHFVKAFIHSDYVYFLFSRRDMWHKKEYQTYASRLCTTDRNFYSYMEVPLLCRGGYNLAQGAWVGNHSGEPALFVVMAAGQASTPVATSRSALCIYGMAKLDAMMRRAQEVCYTERGQGSGGQQEAYIEYAVSSTCLKLPKVKTCISHDDVIIQCYWVLLVFLSRIVLSKCNFYFLGLSVRILLRGRTHPQPYCQRCATSSHTHHHPAHTTDCCCCSNRGRTHYSFPGR